MRRDVVRDARARTASRAARLPKQLIGAPAFPCRRAVPSPPRIAVAAVALGLSLRGCPAGRAEGRGSVRHSCSPRVERPGQNLAPARGVIDRGRFDHRRELEGVEAPGAPIYSYFRDWRATRQPVGVAPGGTAADYRRHARARVTVIYERGATRCHLLPAGSLAS